MNTDKKLKRIAPDWHGEAKQILREQFEKIHGAFLDATNRAVWLGLFLNYVKERGKADGTIPHGEFGPWLKRELADISWDTANRYMLIARGVAEKGKFQITHFAEFAREANLSFVQILAADKLPPKLREIKDRIEAMVAGKTSAQLMLEFKQLDADGNPRVGRRPGEGGKRALSAAEKALKIEEMTNRDIKQLQVVCFQIGANFTCLPDEDLEATLDYMDTLARAMRHWLKTPTPRRDVREIAAMLKV